MAGLSQIVGNDEVRNALASMIGRGRVPHAIMFYENDGCGAVGLALAFLSELLGTSRVERLVHPDVNFIFPVANGPKAGGDKPTSDSYMQYWRELVTANPYFLESDLNDALGLDGKSSLIAVQEAKILRDRLSLSSLEGGYRAVVIYLPEKMNADTANRLLKSIEEPPEMTQFVLITHAVDKVLTTISSRCECIRLAPLSKDEVSKVLVERFGKTPEEAAGVSGLSGGSVGTALRYLSENEDVDSERETFVTLMNALLANDLNAALDVADELSAQPSREKAKAFCKFASEALRKIFLLQQGLESLAGLSPREKDDFTAIASRCRRSFSRAALPLLDRSHMLIGRNINLKILFCDLVNKLYTILWTTTK